MALQLLRAARAALSESSGLLSSQARISAYTALSHGEAPSNVTSRRFGDAAETSSQAAAPKPTVSDLKTQFATTIAQIARADANSAFAVFVPVVDAILDCIPAAVHSVAITSISEAALRASATGTPMAANARGAMPQMDLVISVDPSKVLPVMEFLSSHAALQFRSLVEMTAVDYPERINGRFEVTYVLWSPTLNARTIVKAMVDELTPLESVTPVFKNADWLERETWDMFGVFFKNHPDLRRLLTDYGFSHHPLRKDFPVQGYTEVVYSEERKSVTSRSVQLAQTQRVVSGQ